MDGRDRQALHRGPAPVHPGQLLPLLRARGPNRAEPGSQRPEAEGRLRVPHPGSRPQRAGAFLVQAGLGSPRDHALASLLALNGLRISEALGADIDDLDFERGHRTLKVVRKGGKHATIPLAPRTSRVLDLYIGERTTGPIFLGAKGGRMDRYAADRMVKRLGRRAGIAKRIRHCWNIGVHQFRRRRAAA